MPYSKQQLRVLASEGLGAELPPPPNKRKNEEFTLQCALMAWWKVACIPFGVPEFLLWHTPNSAVYGGSEEQREKMGAMLKRLGQRSGIPDLFLACPKVYMKNTPLAYATHGLFLELKSPTGVVSSEQKVIMAALECKGYETAVVRTLEEGMGAVTRYLL